MKRREFITLFGGAAAWPLAARAQQPAMPVIGVLNSAMADGNADMISAFRQGLKESGYVEGQNVTIDYRWANNQNDRLPGLAADLVRRNVAVIFANGPAAIAAKAATSTIPIVFIAGLDPIEIGLVATLARPGGNLTGWTSMAAELGPKRLELLHELVPTASVVGALVNPNNPSAETLSTALRAAARSLGLQLHLLRARTEGDIDAAFVTLVELRAGALLVGNDPFFNTRGQQLASLALRHAVPAIFPFREFASAGGLMSYGTARTEGYRLGGNYVARILKGERPSDLPVQQTTKVELIINLKTAKALGLTLPLTLLGRAEVIE